MATLARTKEQKAAGVSLQDARVQNQGTTGYTNIKSATNPTTLQTATVPTNTMTTGTSTPTVISDSTIRDKVIPEMRTQTSNIINTYDQTKQQVSEQKQISQAKKEEATNNKSNSLDGILGSNQDYTPDPYTQRQLDLIDKLTGSADARTRAMAERQQVAYDRQRQAAIQAGNTAGGALGTALTRLGGRYTPGVGGQLASQNQRLTNEKLAQIDEDEQSTLDQLREAQDTNDYKAVGQKLELLKGVRDARNQLIEDQRKAEREQQDKVNEIVKNAAEGGAPPEVLDKVAGAADVGDAIQNAGDYLQKGSGTVAEYLYYKRDAMAHGQVPMSYNEYADMDANRKRSIVNVNAGANGLSGPEQTKFLNITNKYQSDAIINAAIKAGQINAVADQIIANPGSATNQLAALYLYVKNLDPDSAVREGELGLAGKTQSYLQQYGNSITRLQKGQVLSPQAATDLAKATKSLVKTWQDTADQKTKLYKAQAANTSGGVGNAFNSYIDDYTDSTNDPVANEEEARQAVADYGTNNPAARKQINSMAGVIQPELGRAYTWAEIKDIIGA